MTAQEFNNKWSSYLEEGFTGMQFDHPKIAEYLDKQFEKEVKNDPGFRYAQIKMKFGACRIYAETPDVFKWEEECNKILENE